MSGYTVCVKCGHHEYHGEVGGVGWDECRAWLFDWVQGGHRSADRLEDAVRCKDKNRDGKCEYYTTEVFW